MDYQNWLANIGVTVSTLLLVMTAVLIHYEGLSALNRWLTRIKAAQHRQLVLVRTANPRLQTSQ